MRLECADRRCGQGDDAEIVGRQLGRAPDGMLCVSARCSYGLSTAILCSPIVVRNGAEEPFPTLYWLTCPYLKEKIGLLEGGPHFKEIRARLKLDPSFAALVEDSAASYRARRRILFERVPAAVRAKIGEAAARSLLESGPGGIKASGNIKCLHIYLANYISGEDDPIGEAAKEIISSL